MSDFFKEDDSETTFELYNKNIFYSNRLLEFATNYSCVVDFKFGEKFLYGRVDRNFVSIEPSIDLINFLVRVPNTSNNNPNVLVTNFVADAFFDLSRQFRKSIQVGSIREGQPYLSNLIAYDGYQNVNSAYSEYIGSVIEAMVRLKKSQAFEIVNFEDFLMFLNNFSNSICKTFPITKTGFVRSRFNSNLNNGLTLEITDLSYQNDDNKINNFVNSPNFEYYLNACNSFGFMVDIDIPWRITADLESIAMQAYASRYGFTDTDVVLGTCFNKVHGKYFSNFVPQLLEIYNLISADYIGIDECSGKPIIVNAKNYTLEQINNLYNESYFIKLYCKLRFLEEESKHSLAKQDQIITSILNLSRIKNINLAIDRFERFVSQPFDYRGSLSYIVREQERREDT
jgi:hypothetical protein